MSKQAIVLLSGGLDSATVLAMAIDQGYRVRALAFDYGQRHRIELDCAHKQAERQGAELFVVTIDPGLFSGTALVNANVPVPQNRDIDDSIPVTYVPARNTLFLSYALALAESTDSRAIFLGVNALDYSGYPDCRPEYIAAFQSMANLATRTAVEGKAIQIHAPLIHMSKADIIKRGLALRVDYSVTNSCYAPEQSGTPCGMCDSCVLRERGFAEAGVSDPARPC